VVLKLHYAWTGSAGHQYKRAAHLNSSHLVVFLHCVLVISHADKNINICEFTALAKKFCKDIICENRMKRKLTQP